MVGSKEEFSAWTTWVAFFTLPLVAFGELAAYRAIRAVAIETLGAAGPDGMAALEVSLYYQFGGMLAAALAIAVFGPHLVAGGALALLLGGGAWLLSDPGAVPFWVAMVGHGMAWVSILAAMGASATGGTPGLRYAIVFGFYAMSNLTHTLAPLVPDDYRWTGLAACGAGLALLPIPTLTWWFAKKQPRPPEEGATTRVMGAALLVFVLLLSAKAVWALLNPIRIPADPDSTMGMIQLVANPITVITTSLLTIPVLLVLQLLKKPAAIGALSGVGALLMSTAAVLTWSMGDATPAVLMLIMVGLGEVFIYPWAYGRMVSDCHWRVTGLLAMFAMLPQLLVRNPVELTAVGAAMILALLAIPIGALGWFADEWVFGDDLGPPVPRGRSR